MEKNILRFGMKYSFRQQITLVFLSILAFPLVWANLELPKKIVDDAINGEADFPVVIFGTNFDRIDYLFLLSGAFLLIVIASGGLKYIINVYAGRTGEMLLWRLRYQLYDRLLLFPPTRFRKISAGQITPMITAEVEPLGGFAGEMVKTPVFVGGQFLIIAGFMIAQQPLLGVLALAVYPIQIWIIPKLQRRINRLARERILRIRDVGGQISESVSLAGEIQAHDLTNYERARMTGRLGQIFSIRLSLFKQKFLMKFMNNFFAQLTPFFFYAAGGYFVIVGELSAGALVAILVAYKDVAPHWKELLSYYQQLEDVRVKYEQTLHLFVDGEIYAPERQAAESHTPDHPIDRLSAVNLVLVADDGRRLLDGATFSTPTPAHIAVIGGDEDGASALCRALAGGTAPALGQVRWGKTNPAEAPDAFVGRRLAYVGPEARIFGASVRDNLVAGLRNRPLADAADATIRADLDAAAAAGAAAADTRQEWIDATRLDAPEVGNPDIDARLIVAARDFSLEEDLFSLGLDARPVGLSVDDQATLVRLREYTAITLNAPSMRGQVETFDFDELFWSGSMAENLVYGAPLDDRFGPDGLLDQPTMRDIFEQFGLISRFAAFATEALDEIFARIGDAPGEDPVWERYSDLFAPGDSDELARLVARAGDRDLADLDDPTTLRLVRLALRISPARHDVEPSDDLVDRLLRARRAIRNEQPEDLANAVAIYDVAAVNPGLSVRANILFGAASPDARTAVNAAIEKAVDALGLGPFIMRIGLHVDMGVGGSLVAPDMRAKVALARAVLRRPDVLIGDGAIDALPAGPRDAVWRHIKERFAGRTLIWRFRDAETAMAFGPFDTQLHCKDGGVQIKEGTT